MAVEVAAAVVGDVVGQTVGETILDGEQERSPPGSPSNPGPSHLTQIVRLLRQEKRSLLLHREFVVLQKHSASRHTIGVRSRPLAVSTRTFSLHVFIDLEAKTRRETLPL